MNFSRVLASLAVLGAGLQLCQAGPVSSGSRPTNAPSIDTQQPVFRSIGSGIYELGKVRIDKQHRSISFPAILNMTNALAEYLVVTKYGKTHESLLRTETEPYHIHVAMLLLGAKGAPTNAFPEDKSRPLPGDRVSIEISWDEHGVQKRFAAENWIWDVTAKSTMSTGDWVYIGSRIEDGVFRAEQDGSIISLIEDPDALINNPRPGRDNDDNWRIKSEGLPKLDSAIEVKITLRTAMP
jgi:hypothetical protein